MPTGIGTFLELISSDIIAHGTRGRERDITVATYALYFIRPPLCTAADTQCWKQNQNVKTKTKTEADLRRVLS